MRDRGTTCQSREGVQEHPNEVPIRHSRRGRRTLNPASSYKLLTTITMVAAIGLSAGAAAATGPNHTVPIHEELVGQMTGIDLVVPFPLSSTFDDHCSVTSNFVISFERALHPVLRRR